MYVRDKTCDGEREREREREKDELQQAAFCYKPVKGRWIAWYIGPLFNTFVHAVVFVILLLITAWPHQTLVYDPFAEEKKKIFTTRYWYLFL